MPKYENSPPPSDYEWDEDEPIFFTLSRPQYIPGPKFITIDRNLIHPSLFGIKKQENSENIENKTKEDDLNQNLEKKGQVLPLNVTENKLPSTSAEENSENIENATKESDLNQNLEKEEHILPLNVTEYKLPSTSATNLKSVVMEKDTPEEEETPRKKQKTENPPKNYKKENTD